MSGPSQSLNLDYDALMEVIRRRRSVRRFEQGKSVPRETLLKIAEAGRWAPSGANAQPFDMIIVDDPEMRDKVLEIFLRQSQRLIDHVKGFPAVKKTYLANTVAIFIVVADPRWKCCFPQATTESWKEEYDANNDYIYLASIGAAIQNLQLAVTAVGLTSAWLSGGGETTTNKDLSDLLGYPSYMEAIGTMPVGFPEKDVTYRYRRPLEQAVHWNTYQAEQFRPDEMVDFYVKSLRPFAMYRGDERIDDWEDIDEKLGSWKDAFTTRKPNPSGQLP